MSIATRTGDQGTTGLMYNRRVSKCHSRVEAYGSVDELNAALGQARATAEHSFISDAIFATQKELVLLMGELATLEEDLPRYKSDAYEMIGKLQITRLDELVALIESQKVSFRGWATPGDTLNSAALDLARTTCRRAERRVAALLEAGQLSNPEILIYLNRLSDVLWLMARWVEHQRTEKSKA
ncbi:MAG: cob(I)yrinic acid a,c-diamide adenosyltransferase [Verrucomicrobiota bacterium]|nr:cob(I)yrinic acid a,c-diamide adenosyltransferase [Verrucomicrobiota bacterium]